MAKMYKQATIISLFLALYLMPIYSHSDKFFSIKDELIRSQKKLLTKIILDAHSQKSTLYKDYVATHLKELSEKENDCYYQRNILNKECLDCEFLTEERIRFATGYAHCRETTGTVATDNKTYQEIGVPQLIEQIPTTLTMGKVVLTAEICSPTTVESEIRDAQSKQQFFENNEAVADELYDELKKLPPGEKALLNMYNPGISTRVQTILLPYGGIKLLPPSLKNSASARNIKKGEELFLPLIKALAIPLVLSPILKYAGQVNEGEEFVTRHICLNVIGPFYRTCRGINQLDAIDIGLALFNAGTVLATNKGRDTPFIKENEHLILDGVAFTSAAIDCVRNGYQLYQQRSSEPESAVHQSLIDIADYMRSAEKIYNLMQEHSALKKQFPDFCATYESTFQNEETKDLMNDLLKTNTFQGSPSPFSNPGRIAVTAESLAKEKERIMPLMAAVGQLDAYVALVQFKKAQGKIVPFIYTTLTKTEKAFVHCKALAHPTIAESKTNNLDLGGDNRPLTTIITGPNGCGKSFAAKALVLNTILSERFGTAQAEEFEHSSIDEVYLVANISDKTVSNKMESQSRYQAEVESIGSLFAKNIKTAHEHKNGLYVVDEPLTATNEYGGAKGLEEYIERVDSIPNNNNLRIVITHHDIKDMDNVTHYQVQDDEGKFILIPGRSDYSNAEKLVTEELNRREREFKEHCLFL